MHLPLFELQHVKLAWGLVKHRRSKPKANGFTTGACFVKLRFERKPGPAKANGLLAIDQKGLLAVQARHYGFEPHAMPFAQLLEQLHKKVQTLTGEVLDGAVDLHTFPKVLGYVFNPVSFWYFHNHHGTCRAILCEVNNTFGERHFYLLNDELKRDVPIDHGMLLHATKVFHVSPFFPVSGRYEFRFANVGPRTVARINYFEDQTLQLSTSVSGELSHPSAGLWGRTLVKYGWFTLAVIIKIHWQAVKLLFKGAKFHRKPAPPSQLISHTEQEA
ncbi:DUF1365 domain-containing protein [Limnobacter sp.]|uniref:DUF1365 domain-containing protein n=1 Tax=Limnobacter sp. TaxID=2003368 RepID=UPI00351975DC